MNELDTMDNYSLKRSIINKIIDDGELVEENKQQLKSLNDELYNYAKLLTYDDLKFKTSYFIKFVDTPLKYRNELHSLIIKIFKDYSLCLGATKHIDDYNLADFFSKFDEYDFWLIDLSSEKDIERIADFIKDSKRVSSNIIKCICIELTKSQNKKIANMKNEFKKYDFDYDFIYPYIEHYKDVSSRFYYGGIDIKLEENFNYDEYLENQTIIDHQIIKEKIKNPKKSIDYDMLINKKYDCNCQIGLNELVGLGNVKRKIEQWRKYLKFTKDININDNIFLNTIFKGNPGTGKTTVARIYTNILYELGYIKEDKMVSIVPSDLMGQYVGQTQSTTREILDKARNGVLFIDEAYNLNIAKEYDGGTYMREAVVELLKYMENRENVVVFSGYTKEMDELLELNPGFKSRIGEIIVFDDYDADELVDIFKLNLKKYKMTIDKKAENKLKEIFEKKLNIKNFGNARYVEKYLSKVIMKHSENVYDKKSNIYKITTDDLDINDTNEKSLFGF